MDGRVKQPLPSALRGLPVARIFVDVWDEPRVEDRFAVMPGIKPAIEIEIRTVDFKISQSGHALQGVQSLWQEYGIRFVDGCDRKRCQHKAVVVHDRNDLLTRLMFVAGIADAIAAFFGDGIGAIAMQDAEIKVVLLRQMPYAGDERQVERAIISSFREHLVDSWLRVSGTTKMP